MNYNKSISIIIPHYSNTRLLDRLLSTIPSEDYLQTIVVDDCSPEQEVKESLAELQKKYPNVKFLMLQKNGGGGYARNQGLKLANTDYVLFADCDDFFLPTLKWVLKKYAQDEVLHDVVYFDAISMDSDNYAISNRAGHLQRMFKEKLSSEDKAKHKMRFLFGEPWCKLVSRHMIVENNIMFDEIPIHNDTRFSYLVGYYGKDIVLDGATIYCITERVESVSKGIGWDKVKCRAEVFSAKYKFMKEHSIEAKEGFLASTFKEALKSKDKSKYFELRDIYQKYGISINSLLFTLIKQHIKNKVIGIMKKYKELLARGG